MNHLFLALFLIFSALHLYYSWQDDKKGRAKTKPFLLLFLLLFYVFSTWPLRVTLVLALITSWLGDVLLIPKGHKWFTAGGISFMFSHFFFINVYALRIDLHSVHWLMVLPVAAIYFYISVRVILAVRDNTPKMMVFPMWFYLLANSTMNVCAFMQLLSTHSLGAVIAYIGAVFFFISDCVLFIVRYHPKKDIIFKNHFTVMWTYLLGELLITIGVLMLGG